MAAKQPALDFQSPPHPWVENRRQAKPHVTDDERIGFNGRLGAFITRAVGTMWAFYIAAVVMALWMILATFGPLHGVDPYPFAFLLFLGNIVQLLLMFVIMVGQQVLGAASDKRAIQTYKDAEAILHECLRLQAHMHDQDRLLNDIMARAQGATAGGRP